MFVFFVFLFVAASFCAKTWRPVVLMHGLLANNGTLSSLKDSIAQSFPGIYVRNMEIGNGRLDSLFRNINMQCEEFAQNVRADPNLKNGSNNKTSEPKSNPLCAGFNAIGHSQGGLITRCYIERYNNPPVFNWVSLAGPHQGQFGVPVFNSPEFCPDVDCDWIDAIFDEVLLENSWLSDRTQNLLSFAAFWHDPFDQVGFAQKNIFLADINNARTVKNSTYKANFLSLNHAALIYSTTDEIVIPSVSPWFSFFDYVNATDTRIDNFKELPDFQEDWIGLKTMYNAKKVSFHSVPCSHHDIPQPSCKKYLDLYAIPWLNNTL